MTALNAVLKCERGSEENSRRLYHSLLLSSRTESKNL